jgi:hypothetical protein
MLPSLRTTTLIVCTVLAPPLSGVAAAQAPGTRAASGVASRHPIAIEVVAGWAGFVDEETIDHSVFGGAARFYLTPRLSVGPEAVFMKGPGEDRDFMATGNVTFDLLGPAGGRRPRITPFVVGGAGIFRNRNRFFGGPYAHSEGAFTAGGGVRAFVTDRVYVASDVRIGWELHLRATVSAGIQLFR